MSAHRSPAVAGLALAGILLAGDAAADPRWWWNDLRLTDTPTESITPHLVAPGYATGGAGGSAVFVVWSEIDAVGGDLEVWMTATFDGGCTFCPATRLTDDALDDTNPRVAVLALPEGTWSYGVAFERGNQVLVAWDSTTVNFRVPFDQLCTEFADLGPTIIANDKYVRFGLTLASEPDIVAVGTPAFGHFHACWTDVGFAGTSISYAHDLTARGGLGWTLDPPRFMPQPPRSTSSTQPAIAADLATDPDPVTGNTTGDRSAVNVVWVENLPTDETRIYHARSIDSGTTFSPTGARADAPSEELSDATGPTTIVARPAIDAAYSSFTTDQPAWVATTWEDGRAGGPGPDVWCDARYFPDPATPLPDWQAPDEAVTTTAQPTEGDTSLALIYGFNGPAPAWIAWEDSRFGNAEVAYRTGMLDAVVPDVIDLGQFPYAPARALDPTTGADRQLSHCAFDPATFDCVPTRTTGDALDVEVDANEFATYAVWSDSRFGPREIFFKRTDRFVSNQRPQLAAGCGPAGDAWIDVTFDLVVTCPAPFAGERMTRYLVYHGTDAGGPFANAASPIEVLHDPAGGPTVTRRITGLLPGTTYQVVVVPEDEARNVYPSDFEPTRDAPAAHPNEASIATPAPCVAPPLCLWRSDVTSLQPHVPAREAVYLVPPSPEDIHLQGAAYQCPFADNDLEQDANALGNGVPLVLYQVNRLVASLRLAKDATTIRFRF